MSCRELEDKGIPVRRSGKGAMTEEMYDACKDVSKAVEVVHGARMFRKSAKLRPMAVVKG